jgi:hypothetical protein
VRVHSNRTSTPRPARSAIDQRAVSAAGHVLMSWIWLERQARTIPRRFTAPLAARAVEPTNTARNGMSQ